MVKKSFSVNTVYMESLWLKMNKECFDNGTIQSKITDNVKKLTDNYTYNVHYDTIISLYNEIISNGRINHGRIVAINMFLYHCKLQSVIRANTYILLSIFFKNEFISLEL